jgi:hypothetical protein
MKKILFSVLIISASLFSSFEAVVINPNSVRIGNITGFKKGDTAAPFDFGGNPGTGASYMVPFGIPELSMQEAYYYSSVKNIPFMISGINFGNSDYRENTFRISTAVFRQAGIEIYPALKYMNMNTVLGSESSFGLDISAKYALYEKLTAVMSVYNIYAYETDQIDIPMTMMLNFEFRGVEFFNLYTGLEKDGTNAAIFKTGLEYAPFEFFAVSAGYNFDPELITAGFAIEYQILNFSYGMSYHFDLEYSHSAGLTYEF